MATANIYIPASRIVITKLSCLLRVYPHPSLLKPKQLEAIKSYSDYQSERDACNSFSSKPVSFYCHAKWKLLSHEVLQTTLKQRDYMHFAYPVTCPMQIQKRKEKKVHCRNVRLNKISPEQPPEQLLKLKHRGLFNQ